MSKRTVIIVTSLILLLAIGGAWFVNHNRVSTTAANAPVTTGTSLVFSAPLPAKGTASVTTSDGKKVKDVTLDANSQRFNIELSPGVYQIAVTFSDKNLAPLPNQTITVSSGTLQETVITLSNHQKEE